MSLIFVNISLIFLFMSDIFSFMSLIFFIMIDVFWELIIGLSLVLESYRLCRFAQQRNPYNKKVRHNIYRTTNLFS
jgi:hypothetical protein